jgi:hypothetical protein
MPSKPGHTSAQPSSASGRGKSTGKRKKDKVIAQDESLVEQEPNENTATMHIAAWRRLREFNPYRFPERTYTRGDREFWTKTQACFWDDFYISPDHMRNDTFVQPREINKEEFLMFSATDYRFVVDTLQKMALFNLV